MRQWGGKADAEPLLRAPRETVSTAVPDDAASAYTIGIRPITTGFVHLFSCLYYSGRSSEIP
uniref:Uncharacterized protein n=1 Tax=Thermogemmatispora argillosa TaxID=2045280 RepID=A0A455SYM4_9CHLR|nr:hypothetical protein KTA_09890 [Thermogemmatispora argillosa]